MKISLNGIESSVGDFIFVIYKAFGRDFHFQNGQRKTTYNIVQKHYK
jgi:hypothetical protein